MHENPAIYLDNAATSFPKPVEVADAMDRLLRESALSPGRAAHAYSLAASRIIFETREALARLFSCPDSSRVAFTANVTESLNLGMFGLIKAGDHVITTGMEHNSVMRPLRHLESTLGIQISILPTSNSGEIEPGDIPVLMQKNTRLIVINHVSNVTGSVVDLAAIGQAKENAIFMVDAAQSAGIFPIDIEAMGIDFLAFTGHKALFGPTGTGGFITSPGLALAPLKLGGTGSNSEHEEQPQLAPDCYESGTPNTLGIAGLQAGLSFIEKTGLDAIRAHELNLTNRLLDGLGHIKGVTVHGPGTGTERGSAVSITMEGRSVSDIAFILDRQYNIMTRAGLHCAPAAHRTINTFPEGTLRFSSGYFNSEDDITRCLTALESIALS